MYQTILIILLLIFITALLFYIAFLKDRVSFYHAMSDARLKACDEIREQLRELRSKPSNKTAQELLHDLTAQGSALIEISVIDKNNLFIWNR